MVAIAAADLAFALDSIPAIFGLTREPYLVFTANVFALLGLRHLYFLIGGLLGQLAHLAAGLAAVLGFIGVKLITTALRESGVSELGPVPVPHVSTGAIAGGHRGRHRRRRHHQPAGQGPPAAAGWRRAAGRPAPPGAVMIDLSQLDVSSPASYVIAFAVPALDAIIPVLPSESAVVALGVATARHADPRVVVLVLLAALGAFAGDNLGVPARAPAGPALRAPPVRRALRAGGGGNGRSGPWSAMARASSSSAGSSRAAAPLSRSLAA